MVDRFTCTCGVVHQFVGPASAKTLLTLRCSCQQNWRIVLKDGAIHVGRMWRRYRKRKVAA